MVMTHEKPNGLLESCTATSPGACPVQTPHHELLDVASAAQWNEIKKLVKTIKVTNPQVTFDTTMSKGVLAGIASGDLKPEDVDMESIVMDMERQIMEADPSVQRGLDPSSTGMSPEDQWRSHSSPIRRHNGAASWRTQSEIKQDAEPGVLVLDNSGQTDGLISAEIHRTPPDGHKDVYMADAVKFQNGLVRLNVVASSSLKGQDVAYWFYNDPDTVWGVVPNPLGRPFRIKRDGVVEPTVYPAGCVFLYATTPRGNRHFSGWPVFVIDASAHPDNPLPEGFQKVVDPKNSHRALYMWDAMEEARDSGITYAEAQAHALDRYEQEQIEEASYLSDQFI